MLSPVLVQAHLREAARRDHQTARVAGYTCFFHPDDDLPLLSHAVPDPAPEGRRVPVMGTDRETEDDATALKRVRDTFHARRRMPRLEFVREAFPDLPAALATDGWKERSAHPILACTSATWRPPSEVPGLRLEPVIPSTPWATTRDYLAVQREAYGLTERLPERAPAGVWATLHLAAGLLARVDGAPVTAGGFTPPVDGLCEIVGLAALPARDEAGSIAAMLCSALARVALEGGAQAILLVSDEPEKRGIAQRVGFEPVATLVDWRA